MGGHDLLANAHARVGRTRSSSETYPPAEQEPEATRLPKAASYTYFPRVKDLLDEPAALKLNGTISEEELKSSVHNGDTSYSSSGGSSPNSEEAPEEHLQMPQLRHSNSRRSSRFLPFSSKSRDPSREPKPDRTRTEAGKENIKQADSPSPMTPVRSLSNLRRKSWISSSSRSSSPTREAKKKASASVTSIPEKSDAKDATDGSDSPPKTRNRLSKKSNRLSGLFNASHPQPDVEPPPESSAAPPSDVPAVPPIPKSFSTDRLPSQFALTNPGHIPPLPRDLSQDKLKGGRTEPRKKDELWSVFRTLEADHRK